MQSQAVHIREEKSINGTETLILILLFISFPNTRTVMDIDSIAAAVSTLIKSGQINVFVQYTWYWVQSLPKKWSN